MELGKDQYRCGDRAGEMAQDESNLLVRVDSWDTGFLIA